MNLKASMIGSVLAIVIMFAPGSVDILFPLPTGKEAARLRVAVTVDGRSPEAAWGQFLDKLFDHFDRDGDGVLSAAEAARVFPLPLPDGRTVKMDFAKLDANGDGKATRTEFREFYRANGFAPVVSIIRSPTAEQRRLSEALFRHLDRDGDGRLTRAELEKAPALLRRLDENEDEILTPAELLALEPPDTGVVGESVLKAVPATGTPDAVLRLDPGEKSLPRLLDPKAGLFQAIGTTAAFRVPAGLGTVITRADGGNRFLSAKAFYLAQFTDALGSKPSLGKSDLEADPGLQALAAMFDAADRDGDGKLTAAELQAFLDLIELGIACQVVVNVQDRGGNLFDLLDANSDGVLDLAALTRAVKVCEAVAELPLKRDSVPLQVRFAVARGLTGANFGPVPIPTPATPKPMPKESAPRGPRAGSGRWTRTATGSSPLRSSSAHRSCSENSTSTATGESASKRRSKPGASDRTRPLPHSDHGVRNSICETG